MFTHRPILYSERYVALNTRRDSLVRSNARNMIIAQGYTLSRENISQKNHGVEGRSHTFRRFINKRYTEEVQ